jgi:hypothetical protein
LLIAALLSVLAVPIPALAQQTGSISGRVVDTSGAALPGVTVEARSEALPQPRVTVTGSNGEYRFPALQPGQYTLTFTLQGMQTATRQAVVQLALDTALDAQMNVQGVSETVTVSATTSVVDRDSAAIKSGLSGDQIKMLPVGQEYRDLIKLIPGVQFTPETTRGPSAGGSGQDNIYQFDGVNVTLPLFGTLSAEPASPDIAQVTTTKGGARAVDFNRAGGFSVDSVSRSGTSVYHGLASFQFQSDKMASNLKVGTGSRFERDLTWSNLNLGGPVVKDRLFFYASYYRPAITRANQANDYGDLPQYESTRNEGFGKLTLTPANSVLINGSYRHSHRLEKGDVFARNASNTTGTGTEAWLRIGTVEGSWVIDARSVLTFKYTHFANENSGRPDFESSAQPSTTIGTRLPIDSLDTAGRLQVPVLSTTNLPSNAFVQPYIDRYGFVRDGARIGGGTNGYGLEFNDQDFFRDGWQAAYNYTFGSAVQHELHAGFQWYRDAEDLLRRSNGWGNITIPAGRASFQGTPIFFTATFSQQSAGVPPIRSEYESRNFELNDTIRWNTWTFNLGVLMSNDILYGQDLREDASTLSGYVYAAGNKYRMYEIPWSKMIQPRLGATWAYHPLGTMFASYAKYNPAASSLPRAASWARNRTSTVDAHFDAGGALFAATPVASSSGKFFVEDMTPRTIHEVLFGTAREFSRRLTGRAYFRYRDASHFWEDTNNTARVAFNPPADVNGVTVPREPYIADLPARIAQVGSGSTYVIAELDGAYTKYYEVSLESEWRTANAFVRGSYTWSKYYGNFDQDNTTTGNDANIFVGSSFIADGAGRQLWDFRDGRLRGDRPHMFKVYGSYSLPWQASIGTYIFAQSGQPWEMWSYEPYVALTSNTSDTSRYAEKAGSRRSPSHYQMDLQYTQSFALGQRYSAQIVADLFNVANKQTGYNFQSAFHTSNFGLPRSYFDPRRFQVMVRFQF